jgi:hypothetical protein
MLHHSGFAACISSVLHLPSATLDEYHRSCQSLPGPTSPTLPPTHHHLLLDSSQRVKEFFCLKHAQGQLGPYAAVVTLLTTRGSITWLSTWGWACRSEVCSTHNAPDYEQQCATAVPTQVIQKMLDA